MRASVIVSMYNRNKEVLEIIDKMFFPSLLKNASKEIEVIILDDCSPLKEETAQLIKKYLLKLKNAFGRVVFFRNPLNLGFGLSYNRGIAMARGKTLIITNDDVYFPSGSVSRLISSSEEGSAGVIGPITGWRLVCTPQYCNAGPKLKDYSKQTFFKLDAFSNKISKIMDSKDSIYVKNITGFCFAINGKVISQIGAYDGKTFKRGYLEDTDLMRKVSKKYKIKIDPTIYIHHGGVEGASSSFKQLSFESKKLYYLNCYRYAKKWNDFPGLISLWIKSFLCYFDIGTFSKLVNRRLKK